MRTENAKLSSEQDSLQQQLDLVQGRHEEEVKKHEATVTKLQAQLKERGPRRKVRWWFFVCIVCRANNNLYHYRL